MNARDRRALLAWFRPRATFYPWRGAEPWGVLVSEVMLQQTQAERVRPYYERFMRRFPTPASLAAVPLGEAIREWAGLGYNRRAVNLHRAAVAIVQLQEGEVPADLGALRALPGVGPYTAAAVACFGFGLDVPVVETNVRRVFARHELGLEPREAPARAVADAAARALPAGRSSAWSQALMDLARDVCVSRPRCEVCPVASGCAYRLAGRTPVRAPNGRSQAAFEGSTRQARGRMVGLLRDQGKATVAQLQTTAGVPREQAVALIAGLVSDGLARPSPAAVAGSPRGVVRLP